MKVRLDQNSKYYIFIFLLIVFAKNGFYMWDTNDYLILGLFKYADVGLMSAILFAGYITAVYGLGLGSGRYDWFIIVYLLLTIISSIVAFMIFGQSIFRGFLAQRVQLFWFICYFPIRRLFQINKINKKIIIQMLYALAVYELIICTVQYILVDDIMFLSVKTATRNYRPRLYYNVSLLIPVSFMAVYQFLNTPKKRLLNLGIIIGTAVLLMFFCQYRSILMYYAIGVLFVVGLWKKDILKRILIIAITCIIGLAALQKTTFFASLVETIANGIFNDANMMVRNTARNHYLTELGKSICSIFFGRGYPSVSNNAAFTAAGFYNYMYFTDNGIFGMIYCYGVVGILWYIFFWVKLLRDSWYTRKKTSAYIAYILYYLIGIINDFSWFWSANFMFVLVICLLEREYRDSRPPCRGIE